MPVRHLQQTGTCTKVHEYRLSSGSAHDKTSVIVRTLDWLVKDSRQRGCARSCTGWRQLLMCRSRCWLLGLVFMVRRRGIFFREKALQLPICSIATVFCNDAI